MIAELSQGAQGVKCNTVSTVITMRLRAEELAHLDELAAASGSESRSEFIRLLLHREWNRRRVRVKPVASDYSTAFRIGRPKGGAK